MALTCNECHGLLKDAKIVSDIDDSKKAIKEYRKWTLRGHPDKGGDAEMFKKITGCKELFYDVGNKCGERKQYERKKAQDYYGVPPSSSRDRQNADYSDYYYGNYRGGYPFKEQSSFRGPSGIYRGYKYGSSYRGTPSWDEEYEKAEREVEREAREREAREREAKREAEREVREREAREREVREREVREREVREREAREREAREREAKREKRQKDADEKLILQNNIRDKRKKEEELREKRQEAADEKLRLQNNIREEKRKEENDKNLRSQNRNIYRAPETPPEIYHTPETYNSPAPDLTDRFKKLNLKEKKRPLSPSVSPSVSPVKKIIKFQYVKKSVRKSRKSIRKSRKKSVRKNSVRKKNVRKSRKSRKSSIRKKSVRKKSVRKKSVRKKSVRNSRKKIN